MALYMTIVMGGTPIGSPIIGWVGETFGARWTLVGGGPCVIVGVGLAARAAACGPVAPRRVSTRRAGRARRASSLALLRVGDRT